MTMLRCHPIVWLALAAGAPLESQEAEPRSVASFDPVGLDYWSFHPPEEGRVEVVHEGVFEGSSCVRIEHRFAAQSVSGIYFYQSTTAEPDRGRRLRLGGALRLDPEFPGSAAHLWAKVWLTGDRPGEERDLGLTPVRDDEWTEVSLFVDLPSDAKSLQFGVKLVGYGTVHLDALLIESVGPVGEDVEAPAPLAGRELANVLAFTRLLGLVRYFHPSDGAAELNWNDFSIEGLKRIRPSPDAGALAAALQELTRPFAPTVQVFRTGDDTPLPAEWRAPPDADDLEVVSWSHAGLGGPGRGTYTSERLRAPGSDLPPPVSFELEGGVTCRVPLALHARGPLVLPPSEAPTYEPYGTVDDRDTRLAAVALAWNVPQHFFPYFDLVGGTWDEALVEALTSAATDRDRDEFRRTLERLTWHLHDGHARITDPERPRRYALPLAWAWIEDALIVTAVAEPGREDLPRPGDEVLLVDGRPALERIEEEERFQSASGSRALRRKALQALSVGAPNVRLWLEVESPDGARRRVGPPFERDALLAEPRPETVAEIEPGIWYVDVDRATDADLGSGVLEALTSARGLVFDMRGYPKGATFLPCFLTDTPMVSPTWGIPRITRPDREGLLFEPSNWPAPARSPRLTAPTVFLTDARAQSAAETYLSFVEQYRLAEIVGEPTAGTNGNVNSVTLPCGFALSFTGMRVFKQDSSEHHGVGILPTLPVERTRLAAQEGRDEYLERALEEIERALSEGRGAGAEPRTAEDYLFVAQDAYERRQPSAVVEASTRAIASDPEGPYGYAWRGLGRLELREGASALEDLERAVSRAPDDAWIRLVRGRAHRDLGHLDEARADLALARADPFPEVGHEAAWRLGYLELIEGNLDGARESFDALLARDPSSALARFGRFALAHERQDWERALEEIEKAERLMRHGPSPVPLYEWLARTRAGKPDRARRDLERASKKGSEGPEGAWLVPFLDFLLGRSDEAELRASWPDFEPLARRSLLADAAFWAGVLRELGQDTKGAAACYRECIEAGYWDALTHVCAAARLRALR